jgi:hypothetical protein
MFHNNKSRTFAFKRDTSITHTRQKYLAHPQQTARHSKVRDKLEKLKSESVVKVSYKLLHDILFLLIVFFVSMIFSQGLIPGFFSPIAFLKIILAIFLAVILIAAAGKKMKAGFQPAVSHKLIFALIIFSAFLIVNSLLKFHWSQNIIITLASVFIILELSKIPFSKS